MSVTIPKVKLSNGVEMPLEGFGVWRLEENEKSEEIIIQALKTGYRLIDTAAAYCNETSVGNAIKKSGIPRNEIFITTKVFPHETGYEKTMKAFNRSLKKLQTDYIDLYLIHQPYGDYYGSWRALEELYKAGKIKSIGVSNFYPDRLADLFRNKDITIKPMVNQIEFHPLRQREKEMEICKKFGVVVESWGSLAQGDKRCLENPIICDIAKKHGKSVAQICLRWVTQQNVVAIPKSAKQERMKDNLNIFDFKLDDDDLKKIKTLDNTLVLENHYDPEHSKMIYDFCNKIEDYHNTHP